MVGIYGGSVITYFTIKSEIFQVFSRVLCCFFTAKVELNSVWLKNEWGRYLAFIKSGDDKTIIPCFADMQAKDLPQELSHLQAQDINKIGFTQDLMRGIAKLFETKKKETFRVLVITKKTIIATAIAACVCLAVLLAVSLLNKNTTISDTPISNAPVTTSNNQPDTEADRQLQQSLIGLRAEGYPIRTAWENMMKSVQDYAVRNYSMDGDTGAGTFDETVTRLPDYAYAYIRTTVDFNISKETHRLYFQFRQNKETRKLFLDSIKIVNESGSQILNEQEANNYVKATWQ